MPSMVSKEYLLRFDEMAQVDEKADKTWRW